MRNIVLTIYYTSLYYVETKRSYILRGPAERTTAQFEHHATVLDDNLYNRTMRNTVGFVLPTIIFGHVACTLSHQLEGMKTMLPTKDSASL